jgi:hypothetical protein
MLKEKGLKNFKEELLKEIYEIKNNVKNCKKRKMLKDNLIYL